MEVDAVAWRDGPRSVAALDRPAGDEGDRVLVEATMGGDETAFAALVDRYHAPLFGVARLQVGSAAVAEEVVQETWIGFLRGIRQFEWRCTLKTWLFTILVRNARRARERESRCEPVPTSGGDDPLGIPADRFFPTGHHWAGVWRLDRPEHLPTGWASVPEDRLMARETLAVVARVAIELPPAQREVFVLRDVEGCAADETCAVLDVTANHQRVLLHRARVRVRAALESYFATAAD